MQSKYGQSTQYGYILHCTDSPVDWSIPLILTLVRFASLSVRTELWGPLVASLLVEKTQRTLLDIKLTSKWFGLPRTTLMYTE